MTTTVEHALLNVKADYDAAAERDALKTLVLQPGFQAVLRAVAEEDKTKLLWLVGEQMIRASSQSLLMH